MCTECLCCEVVEDRTSGDSVCTGCGLVLESQAWDVSLAVTHGAVMKDTLVSQVVVDCPKSFVQAAGDSSKLRAAVHSQCEVAKAAATLRLPCNIAEAAADALQRITAKHVIRGQARTGLAAACLYYQCKLAEVPRSKETIAAGCGLSVEAFRKSARLYVREERAQARWLERATESKDILGDCLVRLCDLVPEPLQRRVAARARVADDTISELGVLEGRTPVLRAAVALTMAFNALKLRGSDKVHRRLGVSHYTLSRALSLVERHTTKALGC